MDRAALVVFTMLAVFILSTFALAIYEVGRPPLVIIPAMLMLSLPAAAWLIVLPWRMVRRSRWWRHE